MINNILSSKIIISTKNAKKLKELLDLEIKRKKYKRSESNIYIVNENKIEVEIKASDLTAFKATFNNYINLLELIYKTYEVEL
jgi:tRNA threonylcarbamoyladenosine modification (KEOPS) complex  Pcc1 subunit